MANVFSWRVVFLTLGMFLAMVAVSHAAGTGDGIPELVEGARKVLGSFRLADFVKIVGVVAFAFGFWQMYSGHMGGGLAGLITILLVLGGWFFAETVIDTAYAASGVIF